MGGCCGSGRSCPANFSCFLGVVRLYCSFSRLREKAEMRGSIICTLTFIPSTEEETKQAEFRRVNFTSI
jgi:hypothetical protein